MSQQPLDWFAAIWIDGVHATTIKTILEQLRVAFWFYCEEKKRTCSRSLPYMIIEAFPCLSKATYTYRKVFLWSHAYTGIEHCHLDSWEAYTMITTLETVLVTRALERKVVSSKLLHICKSKEFISFNGAGIFEGWTLMLSRTGFAQITLRYGLRLVHPIMMMMMTMMKSWWTVVVIISPPQSLLLSVSFYHHWRWL